MEWQLAQPLAGHKVFGLMTAVTQERRGEHGESGGQEGDLEGTSTCWNGQQPAVEQHPGHWSTLCTVCAPAAIAAAPASLLCMSAHVAQRTCSLDQPVNALLSDSAKHQLLWHSHLRVSGPHCCYCTLPYCSQKGCTCMPKAGKHCFHAFQMCSTS